MNSKQVFLYRPAAKMSREDLAALRKAGFIPVAVENFNDVKVLDPFTTDSRNAVWQAAMEALSMVGTNAANGEGPKTLFGRLLADKLAHSALPTGAVAK